MELEWDPALAEIVKPPDAKQSVYPWQGHRLANPGPNLRVFKGAKVASLELEWKPALAEMVKTVDAKFAECFARFRCQGEVR